MAYAARVPRSPSFIPGLGRRPTVRWLPVPIGLLLGILLGLLLAASPAAARCIPVAQAPGGVLPAADERGPALPAATTEITFLGHASFLIRTHENATAITDYNGYLRAGFPPDVATMNRAHSTHYTLTPEPEIEHVLHGWAENGVIPRHNVTVKDLRVTNVPTNIRDGWAGDDGIAGNSIFIFESAGLCVVHLGHLHHRLKPSHAGRVGSVDVLLAPIDNNWTMPQDVVAQVIEDLNPMVVIPMHFGYGTQQLPSFLALMRGRGFAVSIPKSRSARFAKATLPDAKTVVVLEGSGY